MLSILGLLCALALASQNLTQGVSTIQTQSTNGEFLIDLNCSPFDSANCTSARLLLLIRISLERVCNYIASDLKIKVPIKIQVNFAEITDPNTVVLAEEGRPIIARRISGLTLGPVVSFPRTLAKQAKIISDFGGSVHQSIHAPNVYDLKLTFNSLKSWVFGTETQSYPDLDLEFCFAREVTKALGFKSNLELDPRSNRTQVGPKISTVTVVKDGTKVEKWHVNYFTQFDSMLIASQWGGGWQLLPPSLADAMYFKRLATQFGAFLDSQQTLYDDYLGLQSGPFKSAINKLDQFFDKYQYGISVRFNYIDILWMDEKSPGFVNYHNSNRYNNLMIRFGESRNGLQELLRSSRDHMNDNSIYTEDYLEAFRMIGWSTHKADNELVLKPDGNAIKLAKQWGL